MSASHLVSLRPNPRRRGAIIVLTSVLLVVVFVVIAFVADLGNVIVTKSKLGAAADAAALAAAGNMAENVPYADIQAVGVDYAQRNVPPNYGTVADSSSVELGNWDPESRTFSPSTVAPDAVRVTLERCSARGNAVPYFFARVLGHKSTDVTAEAVAVGPSSTAHANPAPGSQSVYVTSTMDLSNVVLEFEDGSQQRFEGLSGYTSTFEGVGEHAGNAIVGVWVKSGCNQSDAGYGYGEYLGLPDDDPEATVHGQSGSGCVPHVTATFEATGVEFNESGAPGPVRLVY